MADDLKTNVPPTDDTTQNDNQNPKTVILRRPLSDEEQAYRSLDDTVMRPMPEAETIWDAESIRRPAPTAEPRWPRVKTGALVAAVAVVSFVAGGLTARMSSQVPVLFAQRDEPVEATASYEQAAPVEQPEQPAESYEPVEQDEPTADEGTDTGYSTDYDTGYDTTEDNSLQWNFAPESNGSVGYDTNDNEVTLNYDGYSVTFTLDDLLGTNDGSGSETGYTQEQVNGYGNGGDTRYDSGTGYDTEEQRDRDSWGWSGRDNSGFGWGGYSG